MGSGLAEGADCRHEGAGVPRECPTRSAWVGRRRAGSLEAGGVTARGRGERLVEQGEVCVGLIQGGLVTPIGPEKLGQTGVGRCSRVKLRELPVNLLSYLGHRLSLRHRVPWRREDEATGDGRGNSTG